MRVKALASLLVGLVMIALGAHLVIISHQNSEVISALTQQQQQLQQERRGSIDMPGKKPEAESPSSSVVVGGGGGEHSPRTAKPHVPEAQNPSQRVADGGHEKGLGKHDEDAAAKCVESVTEAYRGDVAFKAMADITRQLCAEGIIDTVQDIKKFAVTAQPITTSFVMLSPTLLVSKEQLETLVRWGQQLTAQSQPRAQSQSQSLLQETQPTQKQDAQEPAQARPADRAGHLQSANGNSGVDVPALSSLQRGLVDAHYFFPVCAKAINSLRHHPLFPLKPSRVDGLTHLSQVLDATDYGTHVYGYIIPPQSGSYVFAVAADDAVELLLRHPAVDTSDMGEVAESSYVGGMDGRGPMKPVAALYSASPRGNYDINPSQKSEPLRLEKDVPYYFEVLHKQGNANDHFSIAWSYEEGPFDIIRADSLARLNKNPFKLTVDADPAHVDYNNARLQRIEYVADEETDGALDACDYHPSWVFKRKLKLYDSAVKHLVSISRQFPTFDKPMRLGDGNHPDGDTTPQPALPREEAEAIVKTYLERINAFRESKGKESFSLARIHNVEAKGKRNDDGLGEIRYLVEFDVISPRFPSSPRRISQYIVQKTSEQGHSLCAPNGWKWKKDATVHVVVPIKNQAAWLVYLIENLQRLQRLMRDSRLNLVVVDFASDDADLKALLHESGISHTFITASGPFARALGIQLGIDAVKNPDDVVFASDLHLDITPAVIENARKHSVAGKIGYAPTVIRLGCGVYHSTELRGFWEVPGYGLFAMLKRDWVAIGGMNTHEYGDKWGGEDWEMLDRVFERGYDADRLKEHQFVHFYHAHHGNWKVPPNSAFPHNL